MAGGRLPGGSLFGGAPFFTFTDHFGHVERGTYFERPGLHTGMFRYQLDGVV
jgi:hypothetical protein